MTVLKILGGYLEVETGGMAGGSPPGIWGGANEGFPTHPGPLPPTGIWPSPDHPTHPIAPGGPPPGFWGPQPGFPTPPIYLPPGSIKPPVPIPPTIWPNPPEGQAPIPEHPIVIPKPPGIQGPDLQAQIIWTPQTGWAVVLVPQGTTPTPST